LVALQVSSDDSLHWTWPREYIHASEIKGVGPIRAIGCARAGRAH